MTITKQRHLSRIMNERGTLRAKSLDWELDKDGDNQLDWDQDEQPPLSIFANDEGFLTKEAFSADNGISLSESTNADGDPVLTFSGQEYGVETDKGLTLSSDNNFSVNDDQRGVISQFGASADSYVVSNADSVSIYFNATTDANGSPELNDEKFRFSNQGVFYALGDIVGFATSTVSDPRLKGDITPIEGALGKIRSLGGYTYSYNTNSRKSAGVLSTEVEKVLPSAVTRHQTPIIGQPGTQEYQTVDYNQLHGLHVEAIKELSEIVKLQGEVIEELRSEIEDLRNGS